MLISEIIPIMITKKIYSKDGYNVRQLDNIKLHKRTGQPVIQAVQMIPPIIPLTLMINQKTSIRHSLGTWIIGN